VNRAQSPPLAARGATPEGKLLADEVSPWRLYDVTLRRAIWAPTDDEGLCTLHDVEVGSLTGLCIECHHEQLAYARL
jgi:hypothetical protein